MNPQIPDPQFNPSPPLPPQPPVTPPVPLGMQPAAPGQFQPNPAAAPPPPPPQPQMYANQAPGMVMPQTFQPPASPMPLTGPMPTAAPQPYASNQTPYVNSGQTNDYYADGAKPGKTLGILSIVFGIIIPVVGVILGIIAMVKGFKKGSSLLGTLGIVACIVSVLAGIGWFVFYNKIAGDITYTDLKPFTFTSDSQGGSVTFDVPDKFVEHDKNESSIILAHNDSAGGFYGGLGALVVDMSVLSDAEYNQTRDAMAEALRDSNSSAFVPFKSLLESYLATVIPGMKDVNIESSISYTNDTIHANAWVISYTFTSDGVKCIGRYVVILDTVKRREYDFMAFAIEPVWQRNEDQFEKIIKSISVN